MNKFKLGLVSLACTGLPYAAIADQTANAPSFSEAQTAEIHQIVKKFIEKNPDIVLSSFQLAMEKEQKDALVKMEKAVAKNKDKLFDNKNDPIDGNPKGTQSLVVFMDPVCGFCKKFHEEIITLIAKNKDVKVIFKDIPIMGEKSELAVEALIAAKEQGKYAQLQKAIFSSEKPLTKRQLMKIASSLGINTKKLQEDMKSKAVKDQVAETLELASSIGVNATPTLIINETEVAPGYMTADELDKKLKAKKESESKKS